MIYILDVYEPEPDRLIDRYAPVVHTVAQLRERLSRNGELLLFYFRGNEQKKSVGVDTLWRFVQLAQQKGFPTGQWNTAKPDKGKDFFETKYEIKGTMGVIVYRDGKYLTSVRNIRMDENAKFKDFERLLNDFENWPVRPSPKAFRIAKAKTGKAKEDECCVVL